MKSIIEYNLFNILRDRNGITIGISAGAMNQTDRVIYKDDFKMCIRDSIHVVDGGKVIATGTHKELLNSCKIYRNLYETESLNS